MRAGALDRLFERLDQAIKDAGYLPMSGQIVDASLIAAPRQRNTEEEKAAIKAGQKAAEIWPDKPAKAAQKDIDARWTLKTSKGKVKADGTVKRDIAIPQFGYKSPISIDRRHGFIRRQKVTDAAAHDGARLREGLVDPSNTASDVWADTAYRSRANEDFLADCGRISRIHRKKPAGKPMPMRMAKANARKVHGPRQRRARLRAAEGTDEAHDPKYRHQACRGHHHHGQYRVQSRPMAMVGWANCVRLMAKGRKFQRSGPNSHPDQRLPGSRTPNCAPKAKLTALNTAVTGGIQLVRGWSITGSRIWTHKMICV
jgi:hypothetical protein